MVSGERGLDLKSRALLRAASASSLSEPTRNLACSSLSPLAKTVRLWGDRWKARGPG